MANHPSIFISYRKADALGQAGRLHQSLEAVFGKGFVFYDNSDLEPGMKWPKELDEKVRRAAVVLVLIADRTRWLGVDDQGGRRIDDPDDWVRKEVEAALGDPQKLVVPVLINSAELPSENRLPDSIKPLGYCQHKQIREAYWDDDLQPLIKYLAPYKQANPMEAAENMRAPEAPWTKFFTKHALSKDTSGLWITVNCNRNRHYTEGVLSDFLAKYKTPKNLAFLLSACLYQKPASLAKRLIYELDEEGKYKGMSIAHFRDVKDGKEVAVADLKIGLEPEGTWAELWKTVQEKLHSLVPIPDPVALAQSGPCAGKDRIALVFRVAEKQWDMPTLGEHIAFILSMFDNLPETSRKFLLFFAFEFKFAHLPEHQAACKQHLDLLDTLAQMLSLQNNSLFVAHHKLFPPIEPIDIGKWLDEVAVNSNQNSNRALLDALRSQLHPDDRGRAEFDMEFLETMQEAAYKHLNQPQPDLT
ncbi:MAG: toll/interleukin-1 receptor domain-containing protein [Saprospiraceae bacterium]